jgi:hypothetical protein
MKTLLKVDANFSVTFIISFATLNLVRNYLHFRELHCLEYRKI